jgi:uncharacterized protein with PIN domain
MIEALHEASIRRISAVTYVEAAVVADNDHHPVLSRRLDELVRKAQMRIEPVTAGQAEIARQAYRDFGKGQAQNWAQLGGLLCLRAGKGDGRGAAIQGG